MDRKALNNKVLILAGGGYIFGAETITISVIKYLKQHFNIHCAVNGWNDGKFISILKNEQIEYTEIKLGWIYIRKIMWTLDTLVNLPKGYFKYLRIIKKWKPEIIYHTNYRTLLQLYPIIKKNNIYHVHDMLSGTIGEKIIKIVDKKVFKYIAVSQAIKEDLIRCGVRDEKVKLIHNGIQFDNTELPNYPFEKSGVIRIGIIGQLVPRKGHALLFEALGSIKKSGINFILDIYGTGDVDYIAELQNFAKKIHINEFIIFHGYVNNKSQIYNSVDFCVVPSIEPEPFGLTVIEPADFEKMTIASNIGAIGEIVEDNITGLLFDPQNVNTLIDRLDFIMNKPEFIKEMGKNAKNRYKLKFSNSKMNEEIKKTLVTKIENSNAKS